MKTAILLVLVGLLSGCAQITKLYDAYFMAKFDVNEYQYAARLRTQAQIGAPKCGTPDVVRHVEDIYATANEYKNYAQKIPRNENSAKLAATLIEITDDFHKRYQVDKPPSAAYCKSKFAAIERSSEHIQTVLGAKPR
jgi:hypothetical protein